MRRSTARRVPSSELPLEQPFGELPPPASSGLLIAVGLGALTVLCFAVSGLGVTWAPGALVVGVLAIAGLAVLLWKLHRDRARRRQFDPLVLAINHLVGARVPSRRVVRFVRWSTRRSAGQPETLVVSYNPRMDFAGQQEREQLLDVVERRVGTPFRVAHHDTRRCRMTLEVRQPDPPRSAEEGRAEKVVAALMGKSAQISPRTDTSGQVVAVEVQHDLGPKVSLSGYQRRIERALSGMLPGRWRAIWSLETDEVRFELRPKMPAMIPHTLGEHQLLSHDSYMAFSSTYATDEDGQQISWVPRRHPHFLIVGGTGSGKTSLEHTLVTDLAGAGWRVWVLDGKRIEFIGFREWPNVEMIASRVESQIRMVHAAHELMEHRYDLIEQGKASASDFEPLALVIDEYATFKQAVVRFYRTAKVKGMPAQPPVLELIGDIARLGRTAKVHLVLGIQRPDVTFLDGEMRDNFAQRVSLGRLSPQGAQMMWDTPAIGVTRLPQGQGITLNRAGDPVEVLCHYTPDPAKASEEELDALEELKARGEHVRWPRMMIRLPEPTQDLDTGEEQPVTYADVVSARIVPWGADGEAEADERQQVVATAAPTSGELDEDEAESPASGEPDPFEGYGGAERRSAHALEPGMLVLVDEALEVWGVVQSVEADLAGDDEDALVLDYRDVETGEEELLVIDGGMSVTARCPETEGDLQ